MMIDVNIRPSLALITITFNNFNRQWKIVQVFIIINLVLIDNHSKLCHHRTPVQVRCLYLI
jgi:hypothetical protein